MGHQHPLPTPGGCSWPAASSCEPRGYLEGEVALVDPVVWGGDAAAPGHPGTQAVVTRLRISPRERRWAVWSSVGS